MAVCYCDKSAGSTDRAGRQRTKCGQTISLESAAGKCSLNNPRVAEHANCGVGLAADDLRLGDFGFGDSTMTRRSIMSRQFRSPCFSASGIVKGAAFLGLVWIVPSHASELPSDIWNGGHGGFPSVTANRSGISVTLPEQPILDAGGG